MSDWMRFLPRLRRVFWVCLLMAVPLAGAPQLHAAPQKNTAATQKKKSTAKSKTTSPSSKKKTTKKTAKAKKAAPPVQSFATRAGLNRKSDFLHLKSSVAFVMDQDTYEVLLQKNEAAVLPIASLTKLMTAVVIVESGLSLNDEITITAEDVDRLKNSSSRLAVGSTLTRGELLHMALMSSENRAAHALGRTWPWGGTPGFVEQMNMHARLLGMLETDFVDPTGLSNGNRSSARDLARLANAAHQYPLLRKFSTAAEYSFHPDGKGTLQYNTTNALVKSDNWDIGLQKTGYISEAGRCLLMQARIAGRNVIMVFLDSAGTQSRLGDANRVRHWLEGEAQQQNHSADAVALSPAAETAH